MNCHMCGERQATIHLLELINGQQKSVWLCSICASGRPDIPRVDPADTWAAGDDGGSPTLASFLGQVRDGGNKAVAVPPCPVCGYEIATFQDNNRLGCPACYPHFRRQILPILSRYHRHASHLGKVPSRADGRASRQGELTRVRVALEKAIRAEDYEEAARLRDLMRGLEQAPADLPEEAP
ncbi:UvrB/UvrC motif-containing protein [bacterium]|nr:UvrB/UvrC motif-containing protein [bacterium]